MRSREGAPVEGARARYRVADGSSPGPEGAYDSTMNEPASPPRFRIGMTARVTAVVMLVASLVLVVNTVASRLAFQSRFLTYVNEQEAAILFIFVELVDVVHVDCDCF